MSSDKYRLTLPPLTIVPSEASLVSEVSETESINPLLSPIQSDPDHLLTDSTAADRYALSLGEDNDDFLLKSLKSMTFLTNKYVNNGNESRTSLRYQDEPDGRDTVAEPFIFNATDSRVKASRNSASNILLRTPGMIGRTRSQSIADSIVSEIIHLKELTVAQMKRRRFVVVCIFSIICISIFNLIFLPRTSLDRDLRRIYRGFITYDDVSRILINQLYYKPEAETYLQNYALHDHFTGNGFEYENGVLSSFSSLSTVREEYQVFMGTPKQIEIQLTDGKAVFLDTTNVGYIPYSAKGDVNIGYIYANYGLSDDYERLQKHQIYAQNKIVIIRLKTVHPSILINQAQNRGAAGVVLYSDPYDDGKISVNKGYSAFPNGPARNPISVESSTGSFIYFQPGDPTTPGWSPYILERKERLKNPETIPTIPVVSMECSDVEKILQKMDASEKLDLGWKGALKFDYSPGPSNLMQLKLINNIKYDVMPITNLVTKISGIMNDEEIIIGASGDAISGQGGISNSAATLLEIARAFNELVARGWKPLRTIKLILWDGSSAGNLGSTEYGEYHQQQLLNNCLIYINLDKIQGSTLHVESNPLFSHVVKSVMKMILVDGKTELSSRVNLIGDTVSDYSVFQYHLGIPSINIGYERDTSNDPVSYPNSKFDNFELLRMFDPEIKLHNVQAQFAGLLALELSDREIIDVSMHKYVEVLNSAISSVILLIPKEWRNKNMTFPFEYKQLHDEIHEIHELSKSLTALSQNFDKEVENFRKEILQDYPWFKLYKKIKTAIQVKKLNLKVKAIDKLFVTRPAVADRKWFRHMVYKPSTVNGQLEMLSDLRQSIEAIDFESFSSSLVSLHLALQRVVQLF